MSATRRAGRPHVLHAAFHEAGHAVAASIVCAREEDASLRECFIRDDGTGYTGGRWNVLDDRFVTYGGPWAEAHATWCSTLHHERDEDGGFVLVESMLNADGLTFDEHFDWVLMAQPDDAAVLGSLDGVALGFDQTLCDYWPAVVNVANVLVVERAISPEDVHAFVDECAPAYARRAA